MPPSGHPAPDVWFDTFTSAHIHPALAEADRSVPLAEDLDLAEQRACLIVFILYSTYALFIFYERLLCRCSPRARLLSCHGCESDKSILSTPPF